MKKSWFWEGFRVSRVSAAFSEDLYGKGGSLGWYKMIVKKRSSGIEFSPGVTAWFCHFWTSETSQIPQDTNISFPIQIIRYTASDRKFQGIWDHERNIPVTPREYFFPSQQNIKICLSDGKVTPMPYKFNTIKISLFKYRGNLWKSMKFHEISWKYNRFSWFSLSELHWRKSQQPTRLPQGSSPPLGTS